MFAKRLIAAAALIALTLLNGCNRGNTPGGMPPLVPCEILVQQDGKPLEHAKVSLIPNSGEWNAVGTTDAAGRAKVYTWGQHAGAAEGTYKVVVSKVEMIPGPQQPPDSPIKSLDKSFRLVEEAFGDAETTPLTIDVKKGAKAYTVDAGKAIRELLPER